MNKVDKSQVIVLSFLAFLLVITPFLPSSLRPSYLYLIFNILIIALGVEAGFMSVFSEPSEETKQHGFVSVTQKHAMISVFSEPLEERQHVSMPVTEKHAMQEEEKECSITNNACSISEEQSEKKPKVVENFAFEKNIVYVGISKVDKVKKCHSMPSLFYIDDGEEDDLVVKGEEVGVEDEICGVNGQELYAKAEAFIGNFYKQLKMQREEFYTY